jgi:antitoxin PrlF
MIKSAVTTKYQTTLPSGVRKALDLRPGDSLAYVVEGNRAIVMKAGLEERDPVIGAFLDFVERDMLARPDGMKTIPSELLDRAAVLTEGMTVDLDAPIEGEVAI